MDSSNAGFDPDSIVATRLRSTDYTERRAALLSLYPRLQGSIEELDKEVCEEVQQHPQARRLLTHPGVGPITALATEVFLGDPLRFSDGKPMDECA